MNTEPLRELVAGLSASASALAVLGAYLRARVADRPLDPAIAPHVDEVLRRIGAHEALAGLGPDELRPFAAEIRHFWLVDADLIERPDRPPGWTYDDPAVLLTAGELTEGFANALPRLAPLLDGLSERLEAGGRFLDVGTGVGRLAIAMARRWPRLEVVGVYTWAPSLALAREAVAEAGLGDRIELREQAGEDLPDEARFDLAWLPAPFVRPEVLPRLLARAHRALRPGGWLLFATTKPGDDLRAALMRLRVAAWGGQPLARERLDGWLAEAGYVDVRELPGPPRDFKAIVAARRAP